MLGTPISKEYLSQLDPQSHAYQLIARGQKMLQESGASGAMESLQTIATEHQRRVDRHDYVDFYEGKVGVGLTWDPYARSNDIIVYQAVRAEASPLLEQLKVRGEEIAIFDASNIQDVNKDEVTNAVKKAYRNPEQFEFDAGGYGDFS